MSMTAEQIALVRETFTHVVPIREQAAALFYERLFAIDPTTRPLFRHDLKEQGAKLMAAIATVVTALDRLETVIEPVRALAGRHVRYGVTEQHYASVGAALLWTLEQGLRERFTSEAREAWAAAYGLLSTTMLSAAESHATTGS